MADMVTIIGFIQVKQEGIFRQQRTDHRPGQNRARSTGCVASGGWVGCGFRERGRISSWGGHAAIVSFFRPLC